MKKKIENIKAKETIFFVFLCDCQKNVWYVLWGFKLIWTLCKKGFIFVNIIFICSEFCLAVGVDFINPFWFFYPVFVPQLSVEEKKMI